MPFLPTGDYLQFKGLSNYGYDQVSNQISFNIKSWLDWCFLNIGAYNNVNLPTSGAYGGDFSVLRRVDEPAYTEGQVWETIRKDWVFETGLAYTGTSPISISGVYINGVLKPTGDPTYSHYYNYPLGRVIFNTALDITTDVKMAYSYRYVQTYRADQASWFKELQFNSFRPDLSQFSQVTSGDYSILSANRVQLPAVIIQCPSRGDSKPFELGDGAIEQNREVTFHVLAETEFDRNQIVDILARQNDRRIALYDTVAIADNNLYPLNYQGSYIENSKMYPDYVQEHFYQLCELHNNTIIDVETLNPYLYRGIVKLTATIVANIA